MVVQYICLVYGETPYRCLFRWNATQIEYLVVLPYRMERVVRDSDRQQARVCGCAICSRSIIPNQQLFVINRTQENTFYIVTILTIQTFFKFVNRYIYIVAMQCNYINQIGLIVITNKASLVSGNSQDIIKLKIKLQLILR